MTVDGLVIRHAEEGELQRVVELIHLGAFAVSRENLGPPLPDGYQAAFDEIRADPNALLMVADNAGEVVGTFSLVFIPNISNGGGRVAQIESVHVAEKWRGNGIGEAMLRWAIAESNVRGCFRLQLTSNKGRVDAHRFYERLGFAKSHEGMKLSL
ncbi:MAG: GNAT family N-acetyltransferase [Tepidiformaceae bacterium]